MAITIRVAEITVLTAQLAQLGERFMADLNQMTQDLSDVKTAVEGMASGLDRVAAEIADLKAQIAGGGVLTQAELDALDATVQEVKTTAQQALAKEGTL